MDNTTNFCVSKLVAITLEKIINENNQRKILKVSLFTLLI
jgi:hypothetical protein